MNYYYAVILAAKEGGFTAFFPDFPEAVTQGDDIPECIEMAADALNISLEEYVRERRTIPESSSFKKVKQAALQEFQENSDVLNTSFEPLIQLIQAPDMSQKPVKVTVSFPKSCLDTIDKKANELGMTRSGFLVKAALAYE